MMDLNLTAASAPADLIKDTSEATFMADVVEASQTTPVIVDFWAPWCGPCKTLGPQLEAAVTAAKGAVKMVKLNVDEAQGIAGQLQIQSLPTVYAFWKGQPLDGFQGAIPPSEITEFINRVVKAAGGEAPSDTLNDAVEAAEEMLTEGHAEDAAQSHDGERDEDEPDDLAHSSNSGGAASVGIFFSHSSSALAASLSAAAAFAFASYLPKRSSAARMRFSAAATRRSLSFSLNTTMAKYSCNTSLLHTKLQSHSNLHGHRQLP
jgi:putative thioredoxin